MELIIDMQQAPITTAFIQQLIVHLHRLNYVLLDDLSWSMHPRLHDEIIGNSMFALSIPLSNLRAGMEPKVGDLYTVYTFAGRDMTRDESLEPHTILLFNKGKLLLRIANVAYPVRREKCQCGELFHFRLGGYWGYHCVCGNYHGHNPLCTMHNEKNKLERF